MNGEVFFEPGSQPGRIEKWAIERNESVFVAKFDGHCYGLFIDLNNSLFCSQYQQHKVMKISLNNDRANESAVLVAGNGSSGSTEHLVNGARGIFVDREFNLFVADGYNYRIQRFRPGETNGRTVAHRGTPSGLQLNVPTDVMMDSHGYFFIADNQNHRVIRSNGIELKCIAGCNAGKGSKTNQLDHSYAVQLDCVGNVYVADEFNHRIQRFDLMDMSCDKPNGEGQILNG